MSILFLHFILLYNGLSAWGSYEDDVNSIMDYIHGRKKRLIWGQQVFKEDVDLYPSTAYQATLISSHFCNEGLLEILKKILILHPGNYDPAADWKINIEHVRNMIFTHCPIDQTRAFCGGAAITEWAVQTACHCISRFDAVKPNTLQLNYPRPYNGWEDMIFLFVGGLAFDKSNIPYVSKNFMIHQKCAHVTNISITHNIGIVGLRYRLQKGARIAAPTTMKEMQNHWEYVHRIEGVCLVVGWGSVYWEGRDVYGLPSFDLKKAWRAVRSFTHCYEIHSSVDNFLFTIRVEKLKYKDVQTWSCSSEFGKIKSVIGHGDAGSPISCEGGWYFGVTNWGLVGYAPNETEEMSFTTDTDIVYALYENAWEYRPAFNEYIRDVLKDNLYPSAQTRSISRRQNSLSHTKFDREEKTGSGTSSNSCYRCGVLIYYSLFLAIYSFRTIPTSKSTSSF